MEHFSFYTIHHICFMDITKLCFAHFTHLLFISLHKEATSLRLAWSSQLSKEISHWQISAHTLEMSSSKMQNCLDYRFEHCSWTRFQIYRHVFFTQGFQSHTSRDLLCTWIACNITAPLDCPYIIRNYNMENFFRKHFSLFLFLSGIRSVLKNRTAVKSRDFNEL